MENHRKLLFAGGIILGVSLGLFFISYQFYALPTANTPSTIKVVTQGSPFTLVTDLEKNQQASIFAQDVLPQQLLLNVEIKDPTGSVVFSEDFNDKISTFFTPNISGKYTLVIIPISHEKTTIWAAFGDPAVVNRLENAANYDTSILGPEFELFFYAGLGVFVGIIVLIIGGVKTLKFKIKS